MAVHVRVSVPVLPQLGCHWSLCVIVTLAQVSPAVAEPSTSTLVSAGHSSVTSAGQVMTDGVASTMVNVAGGVVAVLPDSSSAVHVAVADPVAPRPEQRPYHQHGKGL